MSEHFAISRANARDTVAIRGSNVKISREESL
jgi:hypothetical protein